MSRFRISKEMAFLKSVFAKKKNMQKPVKICETHATCFLKATNKKMKNKNCAIVNVGNLLIKSIKSCFSIALIHYIQWVLQVLYKH